MWDLHLHSIFSGDSETPMEDQIQAALDRGLDGICFTDHQDIDYPKEPGEPDFLVDFDRYFPAIESLREKYTGKLEILQGIELGLQPQVVEANQAVASSYPLDFIIGSIHTTNGMDPYYGKYFQGKTDREAFEEYFEFTLRNIKLYTDFDILGHIDYMIRYAPSKNANYHTSDFMDLFDEILKTLIESGRGIEINTSGWKAGLGQPHPHPDILRRYRELGGEIITTGADAHVPEYVGYEFDRARDLLLSCGFKYYSVFKNRQCQMLKL